MKNSARGQACGENSTTGGIGDVIGNQTVSLLTKLLVTRTKSDSLLHLEWLTESRHSKKKKKFVEF